MAEIEDELKKLLREQAATDPSNGFYIKGKTVNKVRKMTHAMIGPVPDMENPNVVTTITRSLKEGFRPEDLPAITNNLRQGSIARGKLTAIGGAMADKSSRVSVNVKVIPEDCGTKLATETFIKSNNLSDYVGRYLQGSQTPLTEEDLKKYIGKEIMLRSPITCSTKNNNYCQYCMGKTVSESGIGIGPQVSAIPNVFLSISLAVFHGKELKTKVFNPETAFA